MLEAEVLQLELAELALLVDVALLPAVETRSVRWRGAAEMEGPTGSWTSCRRLRKVCQLASTVEQGWERTGVDLDVTVVGELRQVVSSRSRREGRVAHLQRVPLVVVEPLSCHRLLLGVRRRNLREQTRNGSRASAAASNSPVAQKLRIKAPDALKELRYHLLGRRRKRKDIERATPPPNESQVPFEQDARLALTLLSFLPPCRAFRLRLSFPWRRGSGRHLYSPAHQTTRQAASSARAPPA